MQNIGSISLKLYQLGYNMSQICDLTSLYKWLGNIDNHFDDSTSYPKMSDFTGIHK